MGAKRDLQGRVQSLNDKGVNIDGTWYNFSNFYQGERQPAKGSAVTVELDEYKGREYLNKLTVIGTAAPSGGSPAPSTNGYASGGFGGRGADTDKRIARQVAIKAAVDFTAYHNSNDDIVEVIGRARIIERFLNEPFVDASSEDAA